MADPNLPELDLAMSGLHLQESSSSPPSPGDTTVMKISPPKRSNFPLPQELRDEIYGYVLEPATVMPATPSVLARTYKFDLSLLAVNKAIAAGAKKYMREHHSMVKISYDCPGLTRHLAALQVPIVSIKDAGEGVHCAFEVTVNWRNSQWIRIGKDLHSELDLYPGRLIMLSRDTESFWSLLSFFCHYSLHDRVYLNTEQDGELRVYCPGEIGTSPQIVIARKMTDPLAATGDAEVVHNLKTATGIGYQLEFVDVEKDAIIIANRATIAPSVIWGDAVIWNQLRRLLELKARIDTLASSQAPRFALAGYRILLKWCGYRAGTSSLLVTTPNALGMYSK